MTTNIAGVAYATPDPLELVFDRARDLALRVVGGTLELRDAADMIWSAAEIAGTVDREGPDQVQAVIAAAFGGVIAEAAAC